jgi:hypothetical protein
VLFGVRETGRDREGVFQWGALWSILDLNAEVTNFNFLVAENKDLTPMDCIRW